MFKTRTAKKVVVEKKVQVEDNRELVAKKKAEADAIDKAQAKQRAASEKKDRFKKVLEKLEFRRDALEESYLKSLEGSDGLAIGGVESGHLLDALQAIDRHITETNNQLK